MKASIMVFAGLLAACSTAQQDNLNSTLANLNKTNALALQAISNGCKVVQPTLSTAAPADPKLAAAATVNAVVCATADAAANAASAVAAAQASAPSPASAP